MKYKKKNKTAKQRNEEIEQDIKIIKIVCKLGGLTENEINKEIRKYKINTKRKMAKNVSVDTKSTQEKKPVAAEEKIEEEKYTEHRNEMYFYLRKYPKYRISAVGRWLENTKGEVIGDADTYFLHILSNQRCESVRECLDGWSEQDEKSAENWETLCQRIEELDGLERIICDEESFEV